MATEQNQDAQDLQQEQAENSKLKLKTEQAGSFS